ncbi:MAG: glycosyltransferase [Terracidiphilus sp.]
MKRILILNSAGRGHHPRYARWILESALVRDAEVILAGPDELLEHGELKAMAGRFQSHYVQVPAQQETALGKPPSTDALIRREFAVWKVWRDTYDRVNNAAPVDIAIIPFADDCLNAIALKGSPFRKTPWMGITLRQMFHFERVGVRAPRPRLSAVRGWLFRRALHDPYLAGLFTIDPTLDEYANRYLREGERKRLIFLPDPAVDHALPPAANARETLGIPKDAKVVLAYGSLAERKGIRALIECASDTQCPLNVYVLLAGEPTPEIAAFLGGEAASALRRQNRLKIIDGYVPDSEEATLLAAADCMWIVYRGFYQMSGALVLAARHGIPCLVSNAGVAGYLTNKLQLGFIVDPDDRKAILAALQQISNDAGVLAANGQLAMRAFSGHSVADFQNSIGSIIESTGCGHSPAPPPALTKDAHERPA